MAARWFLPLVGASLLGACSPAADEKRDEYADAIPDAQMLALSANDDERAAVHPLSVGTSRSALVGDPSGLQKHAIDLRDGIGTLLADTNASMEAILQFGTTSDVSPNCKRWELAQPKADLSWQLTSCRIDASAKVYGFMLRGKKGAGSYLPIFAGRGAIAPRFSGVRRGRGVVGWDFDNVTLLGIGRAHGKVAIGYRAVGKVRTLYVGLRNVGGPSTPEPFSAAYKFSHVRGVRTSFQYFTAGDYFSKSPTGTLVQGTDGKLDALRASVVWNSSAQARAAFAICGPTVQDVVGGGVTCVFGKQCWGTDGIITHEDLGLKPGWPTCAVGPGIDDALAAPEESEVRPPVQDQAFADPQGVGDALTVPAIAEPPASVEE